MCITLCFLFSLLPQISLCDLIKDHILWWQLLRFPCVYPLLLPFCRRILFSHVRLLSVTCTQIDLWKCSCDCIRQLIGMIEEYDCHESNYDVFPATPHPLAPGLRSRLFSHRVHDHSSGRNTAGPKFTT